MTAVLFVATALVIALACLILWVLRTWRLAALAGFILALLAIAAEAPRAATELWGQTVPGIVAATQETLRLESVRASGARSSHYNPKHRFGAIVCYRLPGAPGLGASTPLDPAIQAAIGETPSEADRTCRQTPGPDILRQTEIRLDEATYDATQTGTAVTLRVLQPLGLLEWAWPLDAPLLPWLARPSLGSGTRIALPAEILGITIDPRGRTLLTRRTHDYAVPIAHVRLRYQPPGHPAGVEGFDTVDGPSVTTLAAGSRVTISLDPAAPRSSTLSGVTRTYWWRNSLGEVLVALAIATAVLIAVLVIRQHRRPA